MSLLVSQSALDDFEDTDGFECIDCEETPRWGFERTEMDGEDVCLDCLLERIEETDEEIAELMEMPI